MMKKILFWTGLAILVIGLILFFLAGATGPENQPLVPSIYQTNQAYWLALSFAGFILIVAGLLMKFKRSKQKKVIKSKKKKR